jgi:hypothetical protein
MVEYPQELIERTQGYFSPKYGRGISVDEAIDILNSLADLYEVFIDFVTDE